MADAGHALGKRDERVALRFGADEPPEMYGSVADGDVAGAEIRPGLLFQSGEQFLADFAVARAGVFALLCPPSAFVRQKGQVDEGRISGSS